MSDVASGVFRVASKQIPEQNNKSAILFPFRKRNRNAEYMLLLMLIKQLEILTFYTGSLLLYFHTKREYFMCGFFFQGFYVCLSVPLLFLTHRLWPVVGVSPRGDCLCGLSGITSSFWRLTLTRLVET